MSFLCYWSWIYADRVPQLEEVLYASSSKVDPYAQYDDASPSNPPPPAHSENWDEYAYLYSDRKSKLDGRDTVAPSATPPATLRRPTEMLRQIADFDNEPLDIPEPTQLGGGRVEIRECLVE